MVDELIDYGHADAATIAEWKDGVNEAWADLLELMETRAQLLAASHELHKFFNDCREVLSQIEEKKQRLPEVAARESKASAGTLQRLLSSFEHDVQVLVAQVRRGPAGQHTPSLGTTAGEKRLGPAPQGSSAVGRNCGVEGWASAWSISGCSNET